MSPTTQRILEYLANNPKSLCSVICRDLEITTLAAHRALNQAHRLGRIAYVSVDGKTLFSLSGSN